MRWLPFFDDRGIGSLDRAEDGLEDIARILKRALRHLEFSAQPAYIAPPATDMGCIEVNAC